jgi:hypothetical protein
METIFKPLKQISTFKANSTKEKLVVLSKRSQRMTIESISTMQGGLAPIGGGFFLLITHAAGFGNRKVLKRINSDKEEI